MHDCVENHAPPAVLQSVSTASIVDGEWVLQQYKHRQKLNWTAHFYKLCNFISLYSNVTHAFDDKHFSSIIARLVHFSSFIHQVTHTTCTDLPFQRQQNTLRTLSSINCTHTKNVFMQISRFTSVIHMSLKRLVTVYCLATATITRMMRIMGTHTCACTLLQQQQQSICMTQHITQCL